MPKSLKAAFQNLLQQDGDFFNWITNDTVQGIWFCSIQKPDEIWMSDSFYKALGYDILSGTFSQKELQVFADVVKTLIEKHELKELFDDTVNMQTSNNEIISLHCSGLKISYDGQAFLAMKFRKEDNIHKPVLLHELTELKKLNDIYEATNDVARIGGWEYIIDTQKLNWTKVTKDIHEVPHDYVPKLETALDFYVEGQSRDTIAALFEDAVNKCLPFNTEVKIRTANGNERWVRSFGVPELSDGKCIRVYGAFQDIDTKKRQELDHQMAKERFEIIYKNSSIGIVLLNTNNQVLMANPASLEIFGFTEKDRAYVGTLSFKDLIHPEDLEMAVEYRQRLLSGEINNYTIECRYFNRNGATIWCRVNTSMVRGQQKEDNLIITQVEDITVSKRLAEISTENSNRFISAFEYSPNGMALVSLDGNWLMVNEKLSEMMGYSREDFIKLNFQQMTHPDDLDADLRLLKETIDGKRNTYSIEKRYFHSNGKTVYGLLNVSLIRDNDGEPLYFISQINDISKRVLAEQELLESMNEMESFMKATTQVAIIQADTEGTIIKYNKGAENLLGYKAEELIGKHNVGIFHVQEEVHDRIHKLEAKYGRPFTPFEAFTHRPRQGKFDAADWTFTRKDGSRFSVHLVITSVLDHKGEITGFLGMATDISALKDMEVSLMQARDKAEAGSRSKSEFLANMSHEIRTPLNGVIGFTDLLMKTELSESQKKYMQMVNTSAHSLLDIINDILDFSKIEAGKLELNEEKTDIIDLCSQTIDIVKHQAHAKSLEILLDITPGINRFVYADPIRLRQILVNLLGNAVKFTVQGEVELKVRTTETPEEEEGEMIFSFAIRDTGIGIAPQNIEKIFNAFDQEDASTTRKYGGTGLGITISNKLLALMGSSLHVESELNKGSTFSFSIRFKTEKDTSHIQKTKVNVKRVLVVDDNSNNLIIVRDMLAVEDITTKLVSNGIEALEVLEKDNAFDLAIIDYNMPYLNGIELVKQIRNALKLDSEKLPIMLLHSSIDDEKLIQACIDLDIRFNVTKPILSDQLYDLLDNIHRTESAASAMAQEDASLGFDAEFKVLLAEDNPVNQMLAKTIIQKIVPNANITLAENGLEAVKAYQTEEMDIIFMDIQMPEMSGFEATENIRQIENGQSHIPIVAITARALVGEREECLKLGMDDYITKPINYDALEGIIKKYLVDPYNKKTK